MWETSFKTHKSLYKQELALSAQEKNCLCQSSLLSRATRSALGAAILEVPHAEQGLTSPSSQSPDLKPKPFSYQRPVEAHSE